MRSKNKIYVVVAFLYRFRPKNWKRTESRVVEKSYDITDAGVHDLLRYDTKQMASKKA
jgi:hypothetical protein